MNHPTSSPQPTKLRIADLTPRASALDMSSFKSRAETRPGHWLVRVGWLGGGFALVAGLVIVGGAIQRSRVAAARNETVRDLPIQPVSRVDFRTSLTASGRVESHRKTMILCETERVSVSNEGQRVSSGENSRVLEVIEEGKHVKKGDILCRLDSSEYEEIVRTQQMKTDQARAALDQAQLSLGVAEIAVQEYRQGLLQQNVQVMEGQIALAESDVARANDRLRWTKDMLIKGYVPVAQKAIAQRSVAQSQLDLMTGRLNLTNFNKYGNPRTIKELESEVEKRQYEVTANTQRVTRLQERLDYYRKMVANCTIRSPHEGLVIYAVDPWKRNVPRLEPGVEVYQKQQLFYLPDLSDMEVITYLHESISRQVAVGMTAEVKVEGLRNQTLTGKVTNVGPLPVSSPVWTTSDEVKYFVATVQLSEIPKGLLPGMSAEVQIDLTGAADVLAVPAEAVASEAGHDVCYVAGIDGLERRQITLGRSTRNYLEVTQGLIEGEEVVMNPANVTAIDSLLSHTESDKDRSSEFGDSGSSSTGTVGVE